MSQVTVTVKGQHQHPLDLLAIHKTQLKAHNAEPFDTFLILCPSEQIARQLSQLALAPAILAGMNS